MDQDRLPSHISRVDTMLVITGANLRFYVEC